MDSKIYQANPCASKSTAWTRCNPSLPALAQLQNASPLSPQRFNHCWQGQKLM